MLESKAQRARRLGHDSWRLLKQDRRLVVFPLASAFASLLIGGASFALADGLIGHPGRWRMVIVVGGIIASCPVTFVTLFCGVALASVLARTLDGEQVSARDGWQTARERTAIIATWTLLICTVDAVLRAIEEYLPLGGRIVAFVVDLSWSATTLFAVPVIACEGLGPRATLSRSIEIFRQRWGEQVAGVVVIGIGTTAVMIPAMLLAVIGLGIGGTAGIVLVAIGGAGIVALQAFSAALNQVYRVFLYRTTTAGASADGESTPFTSNDLANPFTPKRRWWN
jgi:hypothetical protein